MWPPDDTLRAAWESLVADRDTAAEFAELVLAPLVDALDRTYWCADPDDLATAAGNAVVAFLKRPTAYDPSRLSLTRYLELIAGRKLNTLWSAGRKHRDGRIPWDSVELDVPARNEPPDDDSPSFDAPELQAAIAAFTDDERRVLELQQRGERRTTAFAAALGLADRPTADQEAEVKRVKDRIFKRLRRAAGVHHD